MKRHRITKLSGLRLMSVLSVIIVLLLAGVSQAAPKPIVIGFIQTMSGPVSMYGISTEAGGKIAVEEINASGGVLGRPLKMITRDDKINPEEGLRQAKNLVMTEKVDFLMGGLSSAAALAVSNYAKKMKKLYIVTMAQSSSITEENGHRYVFRISTNTVPYYGYGGAIALAKTKKVKKIVILGYDYETGKNSAKIFKDKYLEMVPDAQIIDELWAPLGNTEFSAYISKIANSGAEAFFLAAIYGGGELAFTKQAWAFGLYDKMVAFQSCAGDVETWSNVKRGEPYPKNAIATCRYAFWTIQNPKNKAFVEKIKQMTGFWPSYGAFNQYIATYALKAAIEKVGAVDTEKVIDALEGMKLDTWVGKIPIRKCDHQAMMPTWYGFMRFTPDLSFPHIVEVQSMGEESYRTCDQVKALRSGK